MHDLAEEDITEAHERTWREQTIDRSNQMAALGEDEREERIVRAGDRVVDLREAFRRERRR